MAKTPHANSPAITTLIEGYQQFKSAYFEKSKSYEDLVHYGQDPKVMVIACCDSRVDPAIVMSCKPGELFVVRNVANLVPPFEGDLRHHGTSAALEYAVLNLKVSDIIVFGHRHCAGIRALIETPADQCSSDFIGAWMDTATPAREWALKQYPQCSLDEKAHHCERESLLISLDNLMTFPWIQQRVTEQTLSLHAWYLDLDTGTIETFQETKNTFVSLDG